MVVSVFGRCPLCGEQHSIPDARSLDPDEMGCNRRFQSQFDRVLDSISEKTRLQQLIEDAPTRICDICGTTWGKHGKHQIEYVAPTEEQCKDSCGTIREVSDGERINHALAEWQKETFPTGCSGLNLDGPDSIPVAEIVTSMFGEYPR